MYSIQTVDDGKVHEIRVKLDNNVITLKVDKNKAREIKTGEAYRIIDGERHEIKVQMDETTGVLLVGGLTSEIAAKAVKYWHLRNTSSFGGCISDVVYNNEILEFNEASEVQEAEACDNCEKCAPGGFCYVSDCKLKILIGIEKTFFRLLAVIATVAIHPKHAPRPRKKW